jgi:hypothetical protein
MAVGHRAMKKALETDTPKRVSFAGDWGATGWNAPPPRPAQGAARRCIALGVRARSA